MTTPSGDAALRKPPASDLKNDSSASMFHQVIQEQRASDSGTWKTTAKAEPSQLVMTDPYIGVNSVKDLLKKGVSSDCKVQSGEGSKPGDCNFKPDSEYKTEGAKKWRQEALKQGSKRLDVDKDGNYLVQKGDSVWGIAERRARQQTNGRKPTPGETHHEMNKLLEANKQKYPGLDCNPHMLRPGMKLQIPGAGEEQHRRAQRDGRGVGTAVESNKRDNRKSDAAIDGNKHDNRKSDAAMEGSRRSKNGDSGVSLADRLKEPMKLHSKIDEPGMTLTDRPDREKMPAFEPVWSARSDTLYEWKTLTDKADLPSNAGAGTDNLTRELIELLEAQQKYQDLHGSKTPPAQLENSGMNATEDNDAGILQQKLGFDEVSRLQDEVRFLRGGSLGRDILSSDRMQPDEKVKVRGNDSALSLPPLSHR